MGLIKAFTGSAISTIGDMWEDYIYCDSLDENTLVRKGHAKKAPGMNSASDDNVITEGSKIAVNAGQMMIIVENGMILDFSAEPGGYEYSSATAPSLISGGFGETLRRSLSQMSERFAYGGRAGNDQRVYFVNIKEIMNNRFGFGNVPYRDSEFNITVLLQGFGIYSFAITDPILFYTDISGNVGESFTKSMIAPQLKGELQNAMLPVLGELAGKGVHYDKLSIHTPDILELLKTNLSGKWKESRGIEIKSVAFSTILPDDDSMSKIRELQESRAYAGSRSMLGARVGVAQAAAMESAAENSAGAITGFMGMGMAQASGGVNVSELMREAPAPAPVQAPQTSREALWTCSCGMTNSLNFCPKCGSKKPQKIICAACGYEFPDELAEMRFCPNCGQAR